jgi:hypothetical protein
MATAKHRRRSGKKLLGYQARGSAKSDRVTPKPKRNAPKPRPSEAPKPKPRGISNDQARLLGALCRQQGMPYRGQGMTYAEAAHEIDRLRRLGA